MKTKEILNEWKSYLNKEILVEVSIKRFQEQHPDFDISSFNSQLRGNTDYLDIISNTINSGEQHGPDDYIQQFEFYKNSIEPNRKDQEFLTISIPGGETVSLIDKVNPGSCTATYDDIQQFQQARMFILGKASKNKLAAAYEKVLNEANENDFELIADDSNWIVFYPKSVRGSIALARSYWNGSRVVYDKTFNPSKGLGQKTGYMNWCTSVSGAGNMFINYHRKRNLHMYYCINKKVNNIDDVSRKLCISLSKNEGEVEFFDNFSASVNGDNNEINENDAKNYISNLFDILIKDAMSPNRLELDNESYYKSISLAQYKNLRKANEDNIEDFLYEIKYISKYSKDKNKILKLLCEDEYENIRSIAASNENLLLADPTGNLIKQLSNEKSEYIRQIVAGREDLLKADPSGDIIKKLSLDPSEDIRSIISLRTDLLEADPTGKIFYRLADDEKYDIRRNISLNDKLLEADPSGKLIKKLAYDPQPSVRRNIAKRKDLLEVDPTGKLIKNLVNDSNGFVRQNAYEIANLLDDTDYLNDLINKMLNDKENKHLNYNIICRKFDLLKIDPSGDLFKQMWKKGSLQKIILIQNQDLLKVNPSGNLIKKLSNDEDHNIRSAIATRKDLLKADPSGDIIKKLSNDKNSTVKYNLLNNLIDMENKSDLINKTIEKLEKIIESKKNLKYLLEKDLKKYIKLIIN